MRYILFIVVIYNTLFGVGLRCVGATTIQPIIEEVAKNYKKETGVVLNIQGGGSQFGIDSVISDKADIGMASRYLSDDEKKELEIVTIGYDSLAFIVNNKNTINNISTQNLIKIYKGHIKTWQQLNGNNEEIVLISKYQDRGTMHIFENFSGLFHPQNKKNIDKSRMIDTKAWEAGANNDVLVWVGGIPNAIGFISFASALQISSLGMPIKILSLDNVQPSKQSIQNRSYPIVRSLNLVFKKDNLEAKKFANWMKKEFAQNIVDKNLFIRLEK